MFDFLFMGLLKLVVSVFGIFIIIGIGYQVMMGSKVNHTPMLRFIGGLLMAVVSLVYQLCGTVSQAVAQRLPVQYRRSVSRLLQVVLAALIIAGALYIANDILPPYGPINPGNQYHQPTRYDDPSTPTPATPRFVPTSPFQQPPTEPQGLAPYVPPYEVTPKGR